jgi:membrane protein implicated in regulation of membrane protease activity
MLGSQKRLAVVLGARNPAALFIAAAVVGGSLLVTWSVSQSIVRGASPFSAFWSMTLTGVPAATASVATTFDINAALRAAPADAPVQNAGVIGCTYVLTDGHRCD